MVGGNSRLFCPLSIARASFQRRSKSRPVFGQEVMWYSRDACAERRRDANLIRGPIDDGARIELSHPGPQKKRRGEHGETRLKETVGETRMPRPWIGFGAPLVSLRIR
jgi:hypothetical protein